MSGVEFKDITWTGVPSNMLPMVWEKARKYVKEAIEYHGYREVDDMMYWEKIAKSEMQLWVIIDSNNEVTGAMITEVHDFSGQKICDIPICGGGNIKIWSDFMKEILEPWAAENDVNRIEFRTRKASSKILAQHNYYVSDIVLTKKLTHLEKYHG